VLPYLNAEISFIRAFGNRSLLLFFLCVLTRSGDHFGRASALGVSIDINPGIIVVFGPVLALLLLISLKIEADTLLLAREATLAEAGKLNRGFSKVSRWTYLLFSVPCAAATFMTLQFILKLVPSKPGCDAYHWTQQFTDFSFQGGSPSVYCIRDVTDGTPWIYPPAQTYIYIACVAACGWLTYGIASTWYQRRAIPPT